MSHDTNTNDTKNTDELEMGDLFRHQKMVNNTEAYLKDGCKFNYVFLSYGNIMIYGGGKVQSRGVNYYLNDHKVPWQIRQMWYEAEKAVALEPNKYIDKYSGKVEYVTTWKSSEGIIILEMRFVHSKMMHWSLREYLHGVPSAPISFFENNILPPSEASKCW